MMEFNGLTTDEALERLQKFGLNVIPEERHSSFVGFLKKFWGPIPWMLAFSLFDIVIVSVMAVQGIWMALLHKFVVLGLLGAVTVYFVFVNFLKIKVLKCLRI